MDARPHLDIYVMLSSQAFTPRGLCEQLKVHVGMRIVDSSVARTFVSPPSCGASCGHSVTHERQLLTTYSRRHREDTTLARVAIHIQVPRAY